MEDNTSSSDDVELRAIYHLCGDGVLEDEAYKTFMNAFCPDVHVCLALLYSRFNIDLCLAHCSISGPLARPCDLHQCCLRSTETQQP